MANGLSQEHGICRADGAALELWALDLLLQIALHDLAVGVARQGFGVEQDFAEALNWFRLAASQNHMRAQYNLGFMYDNGQGVSQDYTEAARWYQKAAEQGHVNAQNNLGVLYAHGQGVKQDPAEAVRWYRKAAEQGQVNAVAALKQLSAGAVTSNASPSTPKATAPATARVCSNCGIGEGGDGAALKPCSRCKVTLYCGRECQVQHWKAGGHKAACRPEA